MKLTQFSIVVYALLAFNSAFAGEKSDCDQDSHYPLISKEELKGSVEKKNAFIVDVNSEESFKKNHVPGAIHFGSHKKDFTKLLPPDKESLIVAYCGGPMCEAWKKAAEEACQHGYKNIRHFKEGIQGWTANEKTKNNS